MGVERIVFPNSIILHKKTKVDGVEEKPPAAQPRGASFKTVSEPIEDRGGGCGCFKKV